MLLYIGKADRQTFEKRISQEYWRRNSDSKEVKIYVGRLAGERTPSDEEWSNKIDLAEKLLIYTHAPAGNSQNIASIGSEPLKRLQDIHILNWGNHRNLMPEVSGIRWATEYDETKQNIFESDN